MNRRARDGTTEPISRDRVLRRRQRQKKNIFLVQLATSRLGNHTWFMHALLKVVTIHKKVPGLISSESF